MKIKWGQRVAGSSFVFVFIINLLFLSYVAIKPELLSPDESWFFYSSKSLFGSSYNYFSLPNHLSYGSLFWQISILFNNPIILRFLSVLSLISIPLIFIIKYFFYKKNDSAIKYFTILAIWYTSSLSWFSTKLFGPDIISFSIGAWAIFLFFNKFKYSNYISFFLLGLSISLKLNNLIFIIYLGLFILIEDIKNNSCSVKKYLKYLTFFIVGFVVASPIVIFDFSTFVSNIINVDNYSLKALIFVLIGQNVEWDAVIDGGLNFNVINIFTLIFIQFILFKYKTKTSIPLFVSICASIILFSKNIFHVWYLFPLIFLIIFSISFEEIEVNKKDKILIVLFLILNLISVFPQSMKQVLVKVEQKIQYNNRYEIIETINLNNQYYEPDNFIIITEFNIDNYAYHYPEYEKLILKENALIYISKRFDIVPYIKTIIVDAKNNLNGYSLVNETKFLYIIEKNQ